MNYKITFQLKTPISFQDTIIADAPIHNGFVSDVLMTKKGRDKYIDHIPQSDHKDWIKGLPILDHLPQKLYIPKIERILSSVNYYPVLFDVKNNALSSYMFYEKDGLIEYLGSWKKRWANEHDSLSSFGKNKRKVRINNGSFKSYNMPIRIIDIPECWFYFQSDNVDEVERLLNTHIAGLGKKISQGKGLISSFLIESINYNPFEKIIRPIPVREIKKDTNVKLQYTGFQPPYWLPDNQGFCIVE